MLQKRRRPKQYRGQRKVQYILTISSKLFSKYGYENVSTREIANRAKIPVGSIYQFFSDKESILQRLADDYYNLITVFWESFIVKIENQEIPKVTDKLFSEVTSFDRKTPDYLKIFSFSGPTPILKDNINNIDSLSVKYLSHFITYKNIISLRHFWKLSEYMRLEYLRSRQTDLRDTIKQDFTKVFNYIVAEEEV